MERRISSVNTFLEPSLGLLNVGIVIPILNDFLFLQFNYIDCQYPYYAYCDPYCAIVYYRLFGFTYLCSDIESESECKCGQILNSAILILHPCNVNRSNNSELL